MDSILVWVRRVVVSAGLAWAGVTVVGGDKPIQTARPPADCAPFCSEGGPLGNASPNGPASEESCLNLNGIPLSLRVDAR